MRKKILSLFLALATSVGMMNAAVDDSGSCGDNVTYSFNGTTGEMTITGTGPMTDFESMSDAPWYSYKNDITSVTITDGVTSVGSRSFGYYGNLVTVTIGNDVESIGYYAFGDCYKFTTLNLGNSVKHIGDRAFMWAKVLTGFTLPSTLETIGKRAFLQNKVITSLTIPSNVTSIGDSAFFYCAALTSITTEATTPPTLGSSVFENVPTSIPLYVPNGSVAAYEAAAQWTAFDIQGYDPAPGGGSTPANVCGDGLTWELSEGVLTISYDGVGTGEMTDFGYEYDENPVNVAPWKENKSAITTVIVGDGVKSIGNYAFNDLYENFTAVTIANSVERIGVFAFTNAKWVTEMTLPSALQTIDQECFAANFGITSITIPSGVTSIGSRAFSYCTALTSLTCEATTPPTLASGVFYKITSKTSDMSNIPLYVPSESVDAYEAASQWNAFDIQGYFAISAKQDPHNAGVFYSTFYHGGADVILPADVEAYKATISGDALNLTSVAVSGQSIPAGNAVILRSSKQNYKLTVSEATQSEYEGNVLQGVDADTEISAKVTGTCYVLSGTQAEGVGFFLYEAPNLLKAHKAFVDRPNGANGAPRRLRFVYDQATGIENGQMTNDERQTTKLLRDGQIVIIRNGVEYNAAGQRIK